MPEEQEAPPATGLTESQRTHIQDTFRIPVDSSRPYTYWIVTLDSDSEMPSDDELRQIRSYLEFTIRRVYREGFAKELLEMPLPKCSGHNTVVLRKRWGEQEGWFYRALTWEFGPRFVPYRSFPHSLVEVLDLREHLVPGPWEEWKRANPETFPPSPKT